MITIINATNRPGNQSQFISKYCSEYLENQLDQKIVYLTLEDLPNDIMHSDMYDGGKTSDKLVAIQDKYIIPSKKWLIISPEYNGSFPGVFKLFIDALSVRKYQENFAFKKAGLIGVASGRAGNARGMEHLTGLLNYLKITVNPNKLPVSSIGSVLVDGEIAKETQEALNSYLENFVKWLD